MFYILKKPVAFSGKPTPIDLTDCLHHFVRSKTMSIDLTFASTSYSYMTLLSVYYLFRPTPDFHISLNRGYLAVGTMKNGQNVLLTSREGYCDGAAHKMQLRGSEAGFSVWVDGALVLHDAQLTPYCAYRYVEDVTLGQGVVNDSFACFFEGDLLEFTASTQVEPVEERRQVKPPLDLFYQGLEGYENFRIPNLLTTPEGITIASCDGRLDAVGDNPNHIVRAVRTSTDSGETWSDLALFCDYGGKGIEDGAAAIDGALVHDPATGTVWMLYCHTPKGCGFFRGMEASTGFDAQGRKLLWDAQEVKHFVQANGSICTADGTATGYTVDCYGQLSKNGVACGSVCHGAQRVFREENTCFLELIGSTDGGKTWSDPVELNPKIKQPWMTFLGAGPGTGICIKEGPHKGRLVFSVYFTSIDGKKLASTAAIFSDDNAATWHMGASVADGRVFEGSTLTARYLTQPLASTGESQIVELAQGKLRIFLRNNLGQYTCTADSLDGGASWGAVTVRTDMPDPRCQAHILRVEREGKVYHLFSNPESMAKRVRGTVKISTDGTQTWAAKKLIDCGEFSYSCMTELPDGQIGLLYEGRELTQRFVKFPLEWLLEQ